MTAHTDGFPKFLDSYVSPRVTRRYDPEDTIECIGPDEIHPEERDDRGRCEMLEWVSPFDGKLELIVAYPQKRIAKNADGTTGIKYTKQVRRRIDVKANEPFRLPACHRQALHQLSPDGKIVGGLLPSAFVIGETAPEVDARLAATLTGATVPWQPPQPMRTVAETLAPTMPDDLDASDAGARARSRKK